MDLSYNETLLTILNDNQKEIVFTDKLLVNTYFTLLSLNNNHYNEETYNHELETIEDFLRKINNLKVKIQLKRKEEEISTLHSEIIEIYNNKKELIDNYNINKLDILKLLDTLEPSTITTVIDSLTKEKMLRDNHKEYYQKIRESINNNLTNEYIIENNIISFPKENISVSIDEFYLIFNYLLNIDNYPKKYSNKKINDLYLNLVNNLIDIINKKELPSIDNLIPIAITYILTKNINYQSINTSNFNILNIKITDLYSFAKNENNLNTAKWKNISIPNEYLYNKIKEISKKGMYYFEENNFIINNASDFKISISINNLKVFLIEILNTINQSIQID